MSVKNWRIPQVEFIQYITPDGLVFNLHDPPFKAVLSYEGDGFPDPEFETTRGPYQHGETLLSIRLPVRKIEMIYRAVACSRDNYWALRTELDNMLRHSRTSLNNPQPGQLRYILSTSAIRDLDCLLSRGPKYIFPRNWDRWAIQEPLVFTCFNPIVYEPVLNTTMVQDFTPDPPGVQLVFPATFPIYFAATPPSTKTKTLSITYSGSWEEYPTIQVTGPAADVLIEHQTLGYKLALDYTIVAGEIVTFTLTYGRKTIVNNFGDSLGGYLDLTVSNIGAFSIQPDPLAPGGVNAFDITIGDGTPATAVSFQYNNRYEAVEE